MTQGNPFGSKAGPWMTTTKLRALFRSGLTFDEVAEANEADTGWKPSRAAVSNKYKAMGEPPRRVSHTDLLGQLGPIKPEHNNNELRHMLQAEARARSGKKLSESDRTLTKKLHTLLFGRGKQMVVGYHQDVGFLLLPREASDADIVRVRKTNTPPKVKEQAKQSA